MKAYTPEPWDVLVTGNEVRIHGEPDGDEQDGRMVDCTKYVADFDLDDEANARRIVRCVNACKGIPDDVLLGLDVARALRIGDDWRRNGNELLGKLTELLGAAEEAIEVLVGCAIPGPGCDDAKVFDDARDRLIEAIAKAKGK